MRALLAPLLLSSLALGAGSIILDGTAARVGDVLVTVQQAYAYRAIKGFLEGEADPMVLEAGEALRRTVQKYVFEEMVLFEIKSLQFDAGGVADADRALKNQFAKNRARKEIWKRILLRYKLSESAALKICARTLQVERFVQKKVETLTPVITQSEVERYYEQNKNKFKQSDLEALRPNILLLLKKEKTQKGLEEWVRGLKNKYQVVNLLAG